MGFVTRFINGAPQEIKVKINEIDYWSSTKKIQLKENSTENSAEKNIKEDSKFNKPWNFSIKKKEKKNIQIQRTLFPGQSLR